MNDLAFTGKEHLIDLIRSACSASDTQATMAILRDGLSALITSKSVYLPECVYEPLEGHYARREIYKCPETGVSVVAMTWGPGQGTPIHDHCGLWGVEGVWQGEIEIIQYELLEDHSERCRFERLTPVLGGVGSSGCIIPPHEYHTIRNPSPDKIAISLHIYKDSMGDCSIFEPLGDGWYSKGRKLLCLDPVDCE